MMTVTLMGIALAFSSRGALAMDDSSIRTAVDAWLSNPTAAEATYGHISTWETGGVTDMEDLFNYYSNSAAASFNEDIGAKKKGESSVNSQPDSPAAALPREASNDPTVASAPPLPPLPPPSAPPHFRYGEAECATPVAVQVARPEVARPVAGTSTAPFATVVNVQRVVRGWSARGLQRLASWRATPEPASRWFSRAEPEPAAPEAEEMYNQIAAWYNQPANAALRARWGPFPDPDEFQTWPGFIRVTNAFLDARPIEP